MKYKIGDIVVYTEEFTRFTTPTRFVVKDIVEMAHCVYYDVYIEGGTDTHRSPRVSCDNFEKTTKFDKGFLRDTKLNQLGL